MKRHRLHRSFRSAAALLAAVLATACTDRAPTDTVREPPPQPPGPESPPLQLAAVRCTAYPAGPSVTCGAPEAPAPGGALSDLIYGGQGVFVNVTSANPTYNPATEKFTFDVRIRNLIGQAIGTTDGTTADPSGVKIGFMIEPVPTIGTGVISIDNEDGTGTFTAPDQPFYRYVGKLDPFQQSAAKTWQFSVPATVDSMAFMVLVSSPVQYPDGWVEVSHPTYNLSRTYSRTITGTVRDPFGREIPGATITWSSANDATATVTPSGGEVTGVFPGNVAITATSTNEIDGDVGAEVQTGASQFTISGTLLVWTAGAGTTDWNTPGNWDRNVNPAPEDSATVPVVASALYPALVENEGIGRIIVDDGAQVNLGPFNLTASQDVIAAPFGTGGIFATSGRLVMTGTAQDVQGRLPSMRIETVSSTASYNLTANVNTSAPLRINRGRLRSTGFRIRVNNP